MDDDEAETKKIAYELGTDIEAGIKQYAEAVQLKLPRILSNIIFLGDRICRTEDNRSYQISAIEHFEYTAPILSIEHKKEPWARPKKGIIANLKRIAHLWGSDEYFEKPISLLKIESTGTKINRNLRFLVQFKFEKDTASLLDIELFTRLDYNSFNYNDLFFNAKNHLEFTDKYLELVKENLRNEGDSGFIYLPHILNLVPEAIARAYSQRKEDKRARLMKIKSDIEPRVKQIESLDVSDF
jgi:hypothetical protein